MSSGGPIGFCCQEFRLGCAIRTPDWAALSGTPIRLCYQESRLGCVLWHHKSRLGCAIRNPDWVLLSGNPDWVVLSGTPVGLRYQEAQFGVFPDWPDNITGPIASQCSRIAINMLWQPRPDSPIGCCWFLCPIASLLHHSGEAPKNPIGTQNDPNRNATFHPIRLIS